MGCKCGGEVPGISETDHGDEGGHLGSKYVNMISALLPPNLGRSCSGEGKFPGCP